MKILSILVLLVAFNLANAKSWIGQDERGKVCRVFVASSSDSVGAEGKPYYLVNMRVSGYSFYGLLSEKEENKEIYSFEILTKKVGSRSYTRVIGAPINFTGKGLIDIKGKVDLESGEMQAKGEGVRAFSWWCKEYRCKGLKPFLD